MMHLELHLKSKLILFTLLGTCVLSLSDKTLHKKVDKCIILHSSAHQSCNLRILLKRGPSPQTWSPMHGACSVYGGGAALIQSKTRNLTYRISYSDSGWEVDHLQHPKKRWWDVCVCGNQHGGREGERDGAALRVW